MRGKVSVIDDYTISAGVPCMLHYRNMQTPSDGLPRDERGLYDPTFHTELFQTYPHGPALTAVTALRAAQGAVCLAPLGCSTRAG